MVNQELFSKGLAVTQLAFSFLIVGLEVMKKSRTQECVFVFYPSSAFCSPRSTQDTVTVLGWCPSVHLC